MKRMLLLVIIISLCEFLKAQDNSWQVYLQGQAVTSIDFENDNVWAATDSFLIRFNKLDKSTTYYSYPDILEHTTCILKIEGNGVKWIVCSAKPGPEVENKDIITNVYRFDDTNWDKVEYNKSTPINSLAIDRDNIVWITAGTDLYIIDEGIFKQITPDNSKLVFDKVSHVASDKDGNIWLSNYGNFGDLATADLVLIKKEGDNWNSYLSESRLIYVTMCIDNEGNPWIQQFFGIRKLDVDRNSWTTQLILSLDNPLLLQAMEGENKYWFTDTDNGIAAFDGINWDYYTKSNSALPSDRVYQIAIDTDRTKWIATGNGLASLSSTSSIVRQPNLNQEFELFPNPTNDFITLKIPNEIQKSTVDIVDIQGRVIKSFSLTNDQNRLDVSHFSAGVYLVRIQSKGNHIMKKFVKN